MKKFRMVADCTFYADSIDHAFSRLKHHFDSLEKDDDGGDSIITGGKIEISPVESSANEFDLDAFAAGEAETLRERDAPLSREICHNIVTLQGMNKLNDIWRAQDDNQN